jgi:hypothetical protein
MSSLFGWMFVDLVLGMLFLRPKIKAWRQTASDTAVKNWFGAGCVGFISTFLLLLTLDAGDGSGALGFFAAGLAWVAIIAGLESMARDVRARTAQQSAWEQRMRLSTKSVIKNQDELEPELRELLRLEEEEARLKPLRKAPGVHLPAPFAIEQDADAVPAEQPAGEALAGPEEPAAPISLSELIRHKHVLEEDGVKEAEQAAPVPQQLEPQPSTAHTPSSAAASVHLGVQSRFGSGAPAATVRESQSVRLTAPMDASPTITGSVTQMPHSTAGAVVPDAIALPVTAMPETTPVSTTPGAVQPSSAPRVLGPSSLGSGGRFTYQPKLVQSRLGEGSKSVEKTAGGSGTKNG